MKTALLVIDMQNDYLWEKRMPKFAYDTAQLTAAGLLLGGQLL